MSAFRPCIGTRAQIDVNPVSTGQFLVASDTGEAFIDFQGRRIQIAGATSPPPEPPSPGEAGNASFITSYSTVNPAVAMSRSVSGGGPGSGIFNAPNVLFPSVNDDLTTSYSITEHS